MRTKTWMVAEVGPAGRAERRTRQKDEAEERGSDDAEDRAGDGSDEAAQVQGAHAQFKDDDGAGGEGSHGRREGTGKSERLKEKADGGDDADEENPQQNEIHK